MISRSRRRLAVSLASALIGASMAVAAELAPGEELSSTNAAAAEGLLPPEILAFYKRGDWKNAVAEWPDGRLRHDKDFDEATRWNGEHLALPARSPIRSTAFRSRGSTPPTRTRRARDARRRSHRPRFCSGAVRSRSGSRG